MVNTLLSGLTSMDSELYPISSARMKIILGSREFDTFVGSGTAFAAISRFDCPPDCSGSTVEYKIVENAPITVRTAQVVARRSDDEDFSLFVL